MKIHMGKTGLHTGKTGLHRGKSGLRTGKTGWKVYAGIVAVVAALNIAAWNSTAFSDWYIRFVFPVWVSTYGRFTGLFPFSAGEIMIGLGLLLAAAALLLGIARAAAWAAGRLQKPGREKAASADGRTAGGRVRRLSGVCRAYHRFFAWVLLGVSLIMTLNCFILYHGSTFSEKYFGADTRAYTLEELTALRNFVVKQCNSLCGQMPRDENGAVIYTGDMGETARAAMLHLGETYGNLGGYYPKPKPLCSSDFMCQQYMAGYYFPFSMEANYNDVMYIMNKPATFCHELGHLKGYIYEDEANFIGYLACVQSEDLCFRYSGYLSVLNYIDNDFFDAVGRDRDRYLQEPAILPQVRADDVFVTPEEWERIEKKALLRTEVVDAVSDSFIDANLKINGIPDGAASYSRVVRLLLQYYDLYGYDGEG